MLRSPACCGRRWSGWPRREQAGLLRGAGRSAQRRRSADQERLSQARPAVPPGPQPGRPARPRNASRRRPRPTPSSPTRDKRARYDRFGHAAVGGSPGRPRLRPDHLRRLQRHLRRTRRSGRPVRLRNRTARSRARRRSAIRPRDRLRRDGLGHGNHAADPPRGAVRGLRRVRGRRRIPARLPARSVAAAARCAISRGS